MTGADPGRPGRAAVPQPPARSIAGGSAGGRTDPLDSPGGAGDLLVHRIGRLLTMAGPAVPGPAAVLVRGGRVAWTGPERALPAGPAVPELDVAGGCVLPGFVDPHTHLLWAGDRRPEFAARLAGERYDGGGIAGTVAATAAASDAELLWLAGVRVAAMAANGTTTVEVKTGYGLYPAAELRLVRLVRALADRVPVRVEPTLLAHVVPAGVDRAQHVDALVAALPVARAGGARWLDVFCDRVGFTLEETSRLLTAGRAAGMVGRLHAEQLTRTGAAVLAAEHGCASADHLDAVDPAGARALAAAGVVGVLLPTASLATGGATGRAAAGVLRDAGVPLALGTDCNPGTSWCESMPHVLQLAGPLLGLSVPEAVRAATRGGAAALRRDDVGQLGVGARGDMAVLAAEHEADLLAHLGAPAVATTVLAGRPLPARAGRGSQLRSS